MRTPDRETLAALNVDYERKQQDMVVRGIVRIARPKIPLQQLQLFQKQQRCKCKVLLFQGIPETFLDHLCLDLWGLRLGQPVLARKRRIQVVIASEIVNRWSIGQRLRHCVGWKAISLIAL